MFTIRILRWIVPILICCCNSTFCQVPDHLYKSYVELVRNVNSGQYEHAIQLGKIMVTKEPQIPQVFEKLVTAFYKSDRINHGLTYFDSLEVQYSEDIYYKYAIALLDKYNNNYNKALDNLKLCIQLDKNFFQAYAQLADTYISINNLTEPEEYFQNILKRDSLNAAAYFGLSRIFAHTKDWEKVIDLLKNSIRIHPEYAESYTFLSGACMYSYDYENAIKFALEGKDIAQKLNEIEREQDNAINLTGAYGSLGRIDELYPCLLEAHKLTQKTSDKRKESFCLSNLAIYYEMTGQFEKAIEINDQSIEISQLLNDKEQEETAMGNKILPLNNLGRYSESIKIGEALLEKAKARGDSNAVAYVAQNVGIAYANVGNHEKAIQVRRRALKINVLMKNKERVCDLLSAIGNDLMSLGKNSAAIDSINQALKIARNIEYKIYEMYALGSLGEAYFNRGNYKQANRFWHQALHFADSLNVVGAKGVYLRGIGSINQKFGDLTNSESYYREALEHDESYHMPREIVNDYMGLAIVNSDKGDYIKALEYLKRSFAISDSIGIRGDIAWNILNAGTVFSDIGYLDEARSSYKRALQITKELQLKRIESAAMVNLGSLYLKIENTDSALKYFKNSLKLSNEIGDEEARLITLRSLGTIYKNKKDFSKALEYYKKSSDMAKMIGHKSEECANYLAIGYIHFLNTRYQTAINFYLKALELGRKIEDFEIIWISLQNMADVYKKQGNLNSAVNYYKEAHEKIESVREALKLETYKTKFMETKFYVYEDLIQLLIEMGKNIEAYDYLQRFRSRSYLEMIQPDRIEIQKGILPESYTKYRSAENNLRMFRDQLAYQYSRSEKDTIIISALNDSLAKARQEHERILDDIRLNHPGWAQLTGNTAPLSLEEIQSQVLPIKTVLIEYFVGPEKTAVWVIKKDSFDCIEIDIEREDLVKLVEKLRKPFMDIKAGKITNLADISFHLRTARKLYDKVFSPVVPYLSKDDHLIIVPDGVLHYLPFEALVMDKKKKTNKKKALFAQYERVKYLIEEHSISYIPAISILGIQMKTRKAVEKSIGKLLAFGSPDFGPFKGMRPEQEKEVSIKLAAIYKMSGGAVFTELDSTDAVEVSEILKPSALYVGKEATEERFKKEAGDYSNIYLSTHAVVNERQPMYTLIALAQDDDPKEDGFLHSYEVFNMDLNADLVTLSACETGLGKLHRGEAMIGLTRSFMYAGASSVVVSLWSVEESSALLMTTFYENLKKGMPKARALQQAKIQMLSTREKGMSYAHPFLWAPFVMVGEYN